MFQRFVLTVFFLLTIANLLIFIKRNEGFEYVQQASYGDLYPNINKGISNISIEKDNIAILDLKGYASVVKWNILCNDAVILKDQLLPVHFPLKKNKNRYILQANDPAVKPIVIDLDYAPAELYKRNGNSVATNYEISYCSEPFTTTDTASVTKWKDPLDYVDAAELSAVKHLLTDSLHIKSTDSSINKIKIIGSYIYQSVKQSMGIPPDSLAKHSVYQQFCFAKNGQTKIWCANITDIVHLFTSAAGILSRKIGLTGNREIFTTGLHSANECYLPETGEWAYTDITQNILLLTDSIGQIFNTVDLYHLKKLNHTGNIILYSSGDSAVATGPYFNPDKKYVWRENEILYPYPYRPGTLYSWNNKLKRYVSRKPWLEIYSEKKVYDNRKFYLKIYLFYTWLVLGLVIFGSYFFNLKRRRQFK
jgi:hypothetical protein